MNINVRLLYHPQDKMTSFWQLISLFSLSAHTQWPFYPQWASAADWCSWLYIILHSVCRLAGRSLCPESQLFHLSEVRSLETWSNAPLLLIWRHRHPLHHYPHPNRLTHHHHHHHHPEGVTEQLTHRQALSIYSCVSCFESSVALQLCPTLRWKWITYVFICPSFSLLLPLCGAENRQEDKVKC